MATVGRLLLMIVVLLFGVFVVLLVRVMTVKMLGRWWRQLLLMGVIKNPELGHLEPSQVQRERHSGFSSDVVIGRDYRNKRCYSKRAYNCLNVQGGMSSFQLCLDASLMEGLKSEHAERSKHGGRSLYATYLIIYHHGTLHYG